MAIITGNGLSVRETYEGTVFKGEEYIEGDGEDEMVADGQQFDPKPADFEASVSAYKSK